jgi:hypothetical protein
MYMHVIEACQVFAKAPLLEKLRPVLIGKRFGLRFAFLLLGLTELGWRRSPARDEVAGDQEELLAAAHAEKVENYTKLVSKQFPSNYTPLVDFNRFSGVIASVADISKRVDRCSRRRASFDNDRDTDR